MPQRRRPWRPLTAAKCCTVEDNIVLGNLTRCRPSWPKKVSGLSSTTSSAKCEQKLVEWAKPYLTSSRRLCCIMDHKLAGQYSVKGARIAASLALQCISPLPKDRPRMPAVVETLQGLQHLKDMAVSSGVWPATPIARRNAVAATVDQWAEGFQRAVATVDVPWRFYWWVTVSGVFYHLYNQSSYQALDEISPLTFSVGNTMKRVVVIVASVLVFRNPIRPLNALGSAIAVLGTFLYSQATAMGRARGRMRKMPRRSRLA